MAKGMIYCPLLHSLHILGLFMWGCRLMEVGPISLLPITNDPITSLRHPCMLSLTGGRGHSDGMHY